MDVNTQELCNMIIGLGEKYPEEMFIAFCVVLMDRVKPKFEEFIKDLDELSEDDKLSILQGFLNKEAQSWADSFEVAVESSVLIMDTLVELISEKSGMKVLN